MFSSKLMFKKQIIFNKNEKKKELERIPANIGKSNIDRQNRKRTNREDCAKWQSYTSSSWTRYFANLVWVLKTVTSFPPLEKNSILCIRIFPNRPRSNASADSVQIAKS